MSKQLFYPLIIISMIFWGASWISTKVLTNYIDAYEMVFLRMGICFLSMAPIIVFLKMNYKLDFKTFVLILFASLFLVLYSIFMYFGVEHGTGSLGGAMVPSMIPIITYIFVAILNKKTISLKHSFALVLGAFGVLNMINIYQFDIDVIFSKYNIFFIVASMLWAILTIITSKSTKINAFVFTTYTYLIASSVLYFFYVDSSIFTKVINFDITFWFNMFIITILSTTFATSIYFFGAAKYGAKEVSSFVFLVPASAIIIGSLFLDEKIEFSTIIGVFFAMIAIYILNNLSFLKFFKKA
ncbi:DMT family transporter [Aliarcobacter cibarius]|uniref:DMT family transporter n=1 Tax=Aliarcobacter cibarius TaxID=255507 RepID=A0A7L5JQ38_9BACT|nr:DMT family transporter [Aliarcobacter cibarius]QKJ27098.1 EamA/RhaT family transporter [Aliarcobacter cibarius]TLS96902.1 DMT family transporter [Aliarcobacter cibarius]TLS97522.1 DMT family transporter [Aliarcobacter cibarius]TLT02627.1 DMT family transporter [Aliarcobacter cibarius]